MEKNHTELHKKDTKMFICSSVQIILKKTKDFSPPVGGSKRLGTVSAKSATKDILVLFVMHVSPTNTNKHKLFRTLPKEV